MALIEAQVADLEATSNVVLDAYDLPEVERTKVKTVVLAHDGDDLALVIDPRILEDWRFSMLITKVEKDPSLIETVMIKMLGESQYERLLDFYEDEDGFVPATLVSGALEKLLKGVAPNS